jgi:hypothetical protein
MHIFAKELHDRKLSKLRITGEYCSACHTPTPIKKLNLHIQSDGSVGHALLCAKCNIAVLKKFSPNHGHTVSETDVVWNNENTQTAQCVICSKMEQTQGTDRGAVCASCVALLAHAQGNVALLRAAAKYINKPQMSVDGNKASNGEQAVA